MKKNQNGITLIALVVTIIVLIILAGISVSLILGNNGLITKSKEAAKENDRQTAIQEMNFKITTAQIEMYGEEDRMPTLRELALKLEADDDIEYVNQNATTQVASTQDINFLTATSIFTKLKKYSYEFEINSQLQLASINGVKVADVTPTGTPAFAESTVITAASITGIVRNQHSIGGTIQVTTEKQDEVFAYLVYVVNKSTGQKSGYVFNTATFNVDNLSLNTTYELYAIVGDVHGKFKKTASTEATTLSGPPLEIISAHQMYSVDKYYSVTVNDIATSLFDGTITKQGNYGATLFIPDYNYIEFVVNAANIKIYAYGHGYTDGGGSTPKSVRLKKYNESTSQYESYSTVSTNATGSRYELVTLEAGKYKLEATDRYAAFDEWEVEVIN